MGAPALDRPEDFTIRGFVSGDETADYQDWLAAAVLSARRADRVYRLPGQSWLTWVVSSYQIEAGNDHQDRVTITFRAVWAYPVQPTEDLPAFVRSLVLTRA